MNDMHDLYHRLGKLMNPLGEMISEFGRRERANMTRLPASPPTKPREINLEAELLALRTIVMVMVAEAAKKHQESGQGTAQGYVDYITLRCQDSLITSIKDDDALRNKAIDNAHKFLNAIICSPDQTH